MLANLSDHQKKKYAGILIGAWLACIVFAYIIGPLMIKYHDQIRAIILTILSD